MPEKRKPTHKTTSATSMENKPNELRPSEFMRARRPELFSDSRIISEPRLTREVFEYHLDTLTNRKEETVFEHFARRLAEKEICPNLLPQTGPTGGGDSKVDTETYPVAESISQLWYEGLEKGAGNERWGFAFSAKKKWKSKAQSDVANIAGTRRDYKRVFFVTNQFVKDKDRAAVEDELTKKHGVPVRILDRSWIVKCVFEHDRIDLAIETLNLQGYDELERKIVGPRDTERESQLVDLDNQIADSGRYEGVDYQLGEDCLQSALLARALGRARVEIDGRFKRAERVAEKLAHRQQQLRIAYHKAWTAFWWYEDFDSLNKLYDDVEKFAVGSQQATDLELLGNIWSLLIQAIKSGRLDDTAARFEDRTTAVKDELERLSADSSRPINSLQARTQLLLINLAVIFGDRHQQERHLGELREILQQAETLVAYPVEAIGRIVRELGYVFADSSAYDSLFETVVEVTERRTSQGEAGRVLLQRGYQKLKAGRTYDAIRLLGRSQQRLAIREYREEFVSALVGCALAYEAAGLLSAARANVIVATNYALSEYWEHGEILPQSLSCVRKLIWLELQLGRIPAVLQWVQLASALAEQLLRSDDERRPFVEERIAQDRVLAMLLLRTDFFELKWLDFMPDLLERFGLEYSRMALLYALGYEKTLREEGSIPESETEEQVLQTFSEWVNFPGGNDLPDKPELAGASTVSLKSFVLGCEVTAVCANEPDSVKLGELTLAALESLLATSLDSDVVPFVSELNLHVVPSDFLDDWPTYEIIEGDLCPTVNIRHARNLTQQIGDDQLGFREWLNDFLIAIMVRMVLIPDIESWGRRLFRDEAGLGRALNFSDTTIPVSNILGESPKFRLSDWEHTPDLNRFPARRSAPWDDSLERREIAEMKPFGAVMPGTGETPSDLINLDKLKHKNRRVYSLVNLPLWDKAEWASVVYVTVPDQEWPPRMGLGFKNIEAAKKIFKGWLDKVGRIDREDLLKVSIITGIDKDHPAHYKVLVSTNPQIALRDPASSHVVLVTRIRMMTPSDLSNLGKFQKEYERYKRFVILPVHFVDPQSEPTVLWDYSIGKTKLRIVPAWQIGEHDPDVVGIEEDSKPIIPDGIEDAPVLEALTRFKRRQKSSEIPAETSDLLGSHAEDLARDRKGFRTMIKYLTKDQIRGHWICYCGSGNKLRNCHIDELVRLRTKIDTAAAKSMLEQLKS